MAQDSPQAKYSEQYILNNVYDQVLKTLAVTGWGWNGQTAVPQSPGNLQTRLDYASGANPIYIGVSAPGTAASSAFWQIKKLTFDASSNLTTIQYAGGGNFSQIWDNRTGLSYA